MIEGCTDPEMNIIRLSVKQKEFPLCIFWHEKCNDFFSIQSTLNMEVLKSSSRLLRLKKIRGVFFLLNEMINIDIV